MIPVLVPVHNVTMLRRRIETKHVVPPVVCKTSFIDQNIFLGIVALIVLIATWGPHEL